jgi:hypothetical protein
VVTNRPRTADNALGGPDRAVAALRRWAVLLDSAFRVPGTPITFGLDPILGLFPGLGDLATPVFSILLMLHAVRLRVPRVVQLRMLMNSAIDFGLGAVPVIGDLFDVGWKANVRNLALLEHHAQPGVRPSTSDWVFVGGIIAALVVLALLPLMLLAWMLQHP